MDYLREMVSGKKKRFREDGYNLDLTYVCTRIIAMSFPADGIEGFYRNNIDRVAELIEKRHHHNYMVFNLSGRGYNYDKFHKRVIGFEWEDHHSPPIHMLFHICSQIDNFLKQNIENVIVVHCLAGKGRTGTIICCYLLYCGRFKSVQQALDYYGKKRFDVEGLGVNQPCQLRYIQYFYRLLKGEKLIPTLKYIQQIYLDGKPRFNMDNGCRPYLRIIHVKTKKELYSTYKEEVIKGQDGNGTLIKFPTIIPIYGDILLKFINIGMLKESTMFRISINTAFLPKEGGKLIFALADLDPSQVATDERFPFQFNVQIEFENVCNCENPRECQKCNAKIYEDLKAWDIIQNILKVYVEPKLEESQILLFKDPKLDDVDQLLSLNKELSDEWQKVNEKEKRFSIKPDNEVLNHIEQIKQQYEQNHNNGCDEEDDEEDDGSDCEIIAQKEKQTEVIKE